MPFAEIGLVLHIKEHLVGETKNPSAVQAGTPPPAGNTGANNAGAGIPQPAAPTAAAAGDTIFDWLVPVTSANDNDDKE